MKTILFTTLAILLLAPFSRAEWIIKHPDQTTEYVRSLPRTVTLPDGSIISGRSLTQWTDAERNAIGIYRVTAKTLADQDVENVSTEIAIDEQTGTATLTESGPIDPAKRKARKIREVRKWRRELLELHLGDETQRLNASTQSLAVLWLVNAGQLGPGSQVAQAELARSTWFRDVMVLTNQIEAAITADANYDHAAAWVPPAFP